MTKPNALNETFIRDGRAICNKLEERLTSEEISRFRLAFNSARFHEATGVVEDALELRDSWLTREKLEVYTTMSDATIGQVVRDRIQRYNAIRDLRDSWLNLLNDHGGAHVTEMLVRSAGH